MVRAEIARGFEERKERVKIDTDLLEQQLERIAMSDIGLIVTPQGHLIALHELDPAVRAFISGVKVKRERATTILSANGEATTDETTDLHTIKLWDKLKAITTLLKLRGKLDRNPKIGDEVQVAARKAARNMATEELREIVGHLNAIKAIEAGSTRTP